MLIFVNYFVTVEGLSLLQNKCILKCVRRASAAAIEKVQNLINHAEKEFSELR